MTKSENREGAGSQLSPAARQIDRSLCKLDATIDWLSRLTPTNIEAAWEGFNATGRKEVPALEYEDIDLDLDDLRTTLLALPIHDIDDPLVEALLIEKQRELDRQMELVRMRGTEGFIMASIDLFGNVGDQLLKEAQTVLKEVPTTDDEPRDCDAETFLEKAREELAWYEEKATDFDHDAKIVPNPGTQVYTSAGNLRVACDYTLATARIYPLIQHEIGTHTVTRHNGGRQPLNTLACGLADYDPLQEGLAVLTEYLCGYLPPGRLRLLGARVIAAHMAVEKQTGAEIFSTMHEEYGLPEKRAFATAIRAIRGGGLTKDALYLKGLIELMAYLGNGGELQNLFVGKFALKHLPMIEQLLERGLLVPPDVLPRYLENAGAVERLETARTLSISKLFQETPQ